MNSTKLLVYLCVKQHIKFDFFKYISVYHVEPGSVRLPVRGMQPQTVVPSLAEAVGNVHRRRASQYQGICGQPSGITQIE